MPLTAGTTIGPYTIERELGRGGMGVVFLARDTRLGRAVALKALPDDVASDPDRLQRFEREARVLASLNHPNVAAIYGLEESEGRKYLALEHVEGETLADRIARGPIPLPETLDLCVQIAAGMEAAHDAGIVHRDLKPANVMITPGDQAKILDFGLAKGRVATDESGLAKSPALVDSPTLSSPTLAHSPTFMGTMPGMILGTAAYLSPEQARGKVVDRRTDIWSFGCLLYECLTGKLAFDGETVSDTIAKILERPMDWSGLPKNTPPRLRELLERCLERDPKRRLRDMGDARITLEEIKAGRHADTAARTPGDAAAARRRTAVLVAAAGLIGLVGGILGWPLLRGSQAPGRVTYLSLPLPAGTRFDYGVMDDNTIAVICRPIAASEGERARSRLYVRRFDQPEFEAVPGSDGSLVVLLSPDGRTLEYWAPAAEQTLEFRRFRMPADRSGPPVPFGAVDRSWDQAVVWLESGDVIASIENGHRFVRLPANGGPPGPPVSFQSTLRDARFYPVGRPLPGDRGVLLDANWYEGAVYKQGVCVLDPKTGRVKLVLDDGGNAFYLDGNLLFSRLDALFAVPFDLGRMEARGTPAAIMNGLRQDRVAVHAGFGTTPSGTLAYATGGSVMNDRRLIVVDRQGNVSEWSPERRAYEYGISASPEGSRVLVQINNPNAITELYVSKRGEPAARRVRMRPGADCLGHTWSWDGRSFAFTQNANDPSDGIYVADVDGVGEPRRVVRKPTPTAFVGPTSWGSDGTLLETVVDSNRVGIGETQVSPQGGGDQVPKLILGGGEAVYGSGVRSPDGRLLAYAAQETGQAEVYVTAWSRGPAGQPVLVSRGGGVMPRWGRDGRQLYFGAQGKLMVAGINASPLGATPPTQAWNLQALRVPPSGLGAALYDILPDGRLIAVQASEAEGDVTEIRLALGFGGVVKEKLRAARK